NQLQRTRIIKKITDYFGENLEDLRIAVWGLAFKANTNDIRESPSHYLIKELKSKGASIIAFDPEAIETTKQELGTSIEYAEDQYAALERADALVIATEWNEFRRPDFKKMKKLMNNPLIFDGRNLYEPNIISQYGFDYFSVGRPQILRK
ncbi:MAG: UDP-glucose/GDP-mannose dehydrogenase family protein, partial [Candidatus Marinimicrobia bacterium]|nr:UDP-glucose/GDP-mannose dehydrogenase family protein [Candidatus Neomarinimicrobiota bacterium]